MKVTAYIEVINDKNLDIQRRFYDRKYNENPVGIENKTQTINLNEHEVSIDSSHSNNFHLNAEVKNTISDAFIVCIDLHDESSIDTAERTINLLKLHNQNKRENKPIYLALRQQQANPDEPIAAKNRAVELANKHTLRAFFVDPTYYDHEISNLFLNITEACLPNILAREEREEREEREANMATISKPKPNASLSGFFARKNSTTEIEFKNIWESTKSKHDDHREKVLAILSNYTKGGVRRHYVKEMKALCLTAKSSNADTPTIIKLLQSMTDGKELKAYSEFKRHLQFINSKLEPKARVQLKK